MKTSMSKAEKLFCDVDRGISALFFLVALVLLWPVAAFGRLAQRKGWLQ